jgi:hypothetical protein
MRRWLALGFGFALVTLAGGAGAQSSRDEDIIWNDPPPRTSGPARTAPSPRAPIRDDYAREPDAEGPVPLVPPATARDTVRDADPLPAPSRRADLPPVSDGRSGPCREFQQEIIIDGRRELAYGRACRRPDGSWRVVD